MEWESSENNNGKIEDIYNKRSCYTYQINDTSPFHCEYFYSYKSSKGNIFALARQTYKTKNETKKYTILSKICPKYQIVNISKNFVDDEFNPKTMMVLEDSDKTIIYFSSESTSGNDHYMQIWKYKLDDESTSLGFEK